jgi:hypothetical protein
LDKESVDATILETYQLEEKVLVEQSPSPPELTPDIGINGLLMN